MSPQKPKARSPPQQQPSRHSSRLAARSEAKHSPKTSSKQEIIGKTVVDSSKRPRTTRQTSRKAPEAPKASKPTKRGKKAKSHISDVSEPRSIDNGVPDERVSTATPAPKLPEAGPQPVSTLPTITVPPNPQEKASRRSTKRTRAEKEDLMAWLRTHNGDPSTIEIEHKALATNRSVISIRKWIKNNRDSISPIVPINSVTTARSASPGNETDIIQERSMARVATPPYQVEMAPRPIRPIRQPLATEYTMDFTIPPLYQVNNLKGLTIQRIIIKEKSTYPLSYARALPLRPFKTYKH
ncbi:hypothetical protein FRC19_010830 [Serendipita sp. 401]|nr:hypothetical protein FRC19_010830 [Serendipita sp. 401]